MKPLESTFRKPMAALLLAATLWALPLTAAPTNQPVKFELRRSIFVLPAKPEEGRDPFFPKSSRPYEAAVTATNQNVEITALVVRGISGTPDHRLVIINTHTFATGDDADVLTGQGRIHVRCIEIKPRSVIIEVRGQRHELIPSDNP